MPIEKSADQRVFGLNEIVFHRRWNQCMVVDMTVGGNLILRAYNADDKVYSGEPFAANSTDCTRTIVYDRSLLNSNGCTLPTGPFDPSIREMIDRIKNMVD